MVAILTIAVAACSSSDGAPATTNTFAPTTADGGGAGTGTGDGGAVSGADGGATSTSEPNVTTAVITRSHRFIPGAMFGGWGPHLGHLVTRADPEEVWFADDACEQAVAGGADICNVDVDRRIDYSRLAGGAFVKAASQALPPGVQQNTASLLAGTRILTYGVDTAQQKLVECSFDVATSTSIGCAPLALDVGANANYIGAALSPRGEKVVWLTNVVDGGGGSFRWFVDYGSGWNGPRTGDAGGYNDASYIHVAFGTGARQGEMLLNVQLVSGLAPNWTFVGATGSLDLASTSAATFATNLGPVAPEDPVISTDDVAVDPVTNDAHLLARTSKGDALYYHRPAGGAWSAPLATFAQSFRARLVFSADGTLWLVNGPSGKGLSWRAVAPADRVAGRPIAWTKAEEHTAPLPAGYDSLLAIYPVSSVYQSAPVSRLRVAVVAAGKESEALYVAVEP